MRTNDHRLEWINIQVTIQCRWFVKTRHISQRRKLKLLFHFASSSNLRFLFLEKTTEGIVYVEWRTRETNILPFDPITLKSLSYHVIIRCDSESAFTIRLDCKWLKSFRNRLAHCIDQCYDNKLKTQWIQLNFQIPVFCRKGCYKKQEFEGIANVETFEKWKN